MLKTNDPLQQARLDHLGFDAADAERAAGELAAKFGFEIEGRSPPGTPSHHAVLLRQGAACLVVTQGHSSDHDASAYVRRHGDGVADIALATPDVRAAFALAVARGATALHAPAERDGVLTACIAAFGSVRHTLIQRLSDASSDRRFPGVLPVPPTGLSPKIGLQHLDHIAVCVEAGRLVPTVDFYVAVMGFQQIFEERVVIGAQAMNSQVVRNLAGDVTLTILEPDSASEPGQIEEFLRDNGGGGIQHLAFTSNDILRSVDALRAQGIAFRETPGTYYDRLPERLGRTGHPIPALRAHGVLVDEDHAGRLYQIFTRSTHPRKTFFMEVIERGGAQTFGSGNIKALYASIELERAAGRAEIA
ncbi:MAG: 4-hydroxyphenylpyruvate dioxygenase [Ramlibacter sp.]|nr:4-hydroxyphenylpyruvate dioxygenase [Ramlibacter sp.]